MKTREQKIDFIYEKIANKELSFGCTLKPFTFWLNSDVDYWRFVSDDWIYQWDIEEIIWHPVMIWDVLNWWDININLLDDRFTKLIKCFTKKDKPIEKQSVECIDYIYDLISND